MGGTDEPVNLVKLTGREHWIAHLLLFKIYRNKETSFACHMMAMRCEERGIPQVRNSRMYEAIRIICINNISNIMKIKQKGEGNSRYGTICISNIKTRENKVIKKDETIPKGWIKGRNGWNKIRILKIKKIEKFRTKQKRKKEYLKKYGWIETEKDEILKEFDTYQSISKILKKRGFEGRKGNKILSRWLKSMGRKPLIRRNTK